MSECVLHACFVSSSMRAALIFLFLVILAPFLRSGPFVDKEAVAQRGVRDLSTVTQVANSGPGCEPKADGAGSKLSPFLQ